MHIRILSLLALIALIPVSVDAQETDPSRDTEPDTDMARNHYQTGQGYYARADYARAAREFEEAYRLDPQPALLMNISLAYERNLQFDEAIEAVDRYLADHPDAAQTTEMTQRRENLETLRARMAQGREVPVQEPPVDVPDVGVEEPAGPNVTEPDVQQSDLTPQAPPQEDFGGAAMPSPEPNTGNGLMAPGLILAGIGVVGLGVGALFQIMASDVGGGAEFWCDVVDDGTCFATGSDADEAQDDLEEYESNKTIALISFIGGGAVLAAGLLLIILNDPGDESADLALTGGPGDIGLGIRGAL